MSILLYVSQVSNRYQVAMLYMMDYNDKGINTKRKETTREKDVEAQNGEMLQWTRQMVSILQLDIT